MTDAELLGTIAELNRDPAINSILVQLPLPAHIDLDAVLETVAIDKDVGGFHLYAVGRLVVGNTIFPACTPHGVVKLLESEGVPGLIAPQMVKTGAAVIDVGINRLPDSQITGDVASADVAAKASLITPVPGGVGPMTATMLLENPIATAARNLARRLAPSLSERDSGLLASGARVGAGLRMIVKQTSDSACDAPRGRA